MSLSGCRNYCSSRHRISAVVLSVSDRAVHNSMTRTFFGNGVVLVAEFPESSVTMNYRLSVRGSAWSDWNANIIFITWHIIRFKGKWMDEFIWSQQMHLELIRGIARAWNCSLTWNGLGPDRRFQSDTNSLPINLQSMIPWNRIRMYGMHHWKRFENGAVCCKHLPIELCAKSKFCIWYSMVSRVWNGIG